jgi:hypothetical protein
MWGGTSGFRNFDIDKAISVAQKMYSRRGLEFNQVDMEILRSVFTMTVDKSNSKVFF